MADESRLGVANWQGNQPDGAITSQYGPNIWEGECTFSPWRVGQKNSHQTILA